MKWKKSLIVVTLTSLLALTVAGCGAAASSGGDTSPAGESSARPEGWTDETHGDDTEPNYEVVFPEDEVNQIKITIDPDDWEAMQADMSRLLGAPVAQPGVGGTTPGDLFQGGGGAPGAGAQQQIPSWANMAGENPMWVPATIEFDGLTWTNVGVRYKGNSSLTSSWRNGALKLPFKLDFDEFEDEYPEIANQRFYGFKQLSLSNAFHDGSYLRDTIMADILQESGLVAAETAYYQVILDYGEGPVNLGLYVMIEVVDDTVIERCFDDDSGNIYEGDGPGTSLAEGTFNRIQDSFQKENNEEEADWSDIEELYEVLHSGSRTADPEAWRESLESVFDVGVFLKWLAISSITQNWDSYGVMSHNFYLYHDPDTDLLTWISWDHNEILGGGVGGGRRDARAASISLSRDEVGADWPLIRYLLDDPVYYERYLTYLEATLKGAFDADKIAEKCRELAELIAPYAEQDSNAAAFESAVQALINRVYQRFEAANTFLAVEGS